MTYIETTHGGTVDKVKRYGWDQTDQPGTLRVISKHDLKIDHTYQRDANDAKVKSIARDWSWVAFGALIVAERHGRFYVIDGQHRLNAALMRSDIRTLPCVVFDATSIEDEAGGFLQSNKNRKPISSLETYRAKLVSGDETALYLQDLFERNGVEVVAHTQVFGVKCVAIITRLAEQKRDALEAMFPIAVAIAKAEGVSVKERIIESLCYLQHYGDQDLSSGTWRARILRLGHVELMRAAGEGAAFHARGGAAAWASGVMQALNKGIRNKLTLRDVGK